MKIFIGGDHAGFELKKELASYLEAERYDVTDFGAFKLDVGDDYPDFVIPVAKAVANNPLSRGIIIGGSGQGEAICANRFAGARAAVWYGGNQEVLKLSREHNDANILSLGARFLNFDEAKTAVGVWLATPFSGEEKHKRRIGQIDN
jgi:ribose 5-phosphate isomerase B